MEKKVYNKTIEQKNGLIIALFLFQYSLLIPLMSYINSTLLVGFTGIILVIVSFWYNIGFKVNKKILLLYMFLSFILLLKMLFDGTKANVLLYFLFIAVPVLLVFSNPFDKKQFLISGYKLAIINFFVLCLNPFIGKYEYMRFGYGMLLTTIFIFLRVFHFTNYKRKIWKIFDIVILLASLIETIIYGSRGGVIVLILFVVLDAFCIYKEHIFRNLVLVVFAIILYVKILPILDFFQKIASKFGVYSYALTKYRMQLANGFKEASSGRNELYNVALEKIKEHPLVGNPIAVSENDGLYVHNLFLQLGQDLGIVALIILFVFLCYAITKLFKRNVELEDKMILAILFSIAVGRLMFSSVLWRRPEFWMLICFVFSIKQVTSSPKGSK